MDRGYLTYRTIIKKDGRTYHGFVPVLPGCHTQGKTIEEARENLREAITGYLKVLQMRRLPIPKEEGWEHIETFDLRALFTGKKISYA